MHRLHRLGKLPDLPQGHQLANAGPETQAPEINAHAGAASRPQVPAKAQLPPGIKFGLQARQDPRAVRLRGVKRRSRSGRPAPTRPTPATAVWPRRCEVVYHLGQLLDDRPAQVRAVRRCARNAHGGFTASTRVNRCGRYWLTSPSIASACNRSFRLFSGSLSMRPARSRLILAKSRG